MAARSTPAGSLCWRASHCSSVQPRRQIAVQRIVRRGLIGHEVGPHAATDELGKNLGGIAQEADRERAALDAAALDQCQSLVQVGRHPVEVAALEPALDPARPALDREQRGPGHGRRQRLGAAHAAEPAGQDPPAGEVAAIVLAAGLDEGLVGALDDPLRADVDPGAGGHLAVHHQALAIELVEFFPSGPVRDQIGVGDQDAGCVGVGPEHADRLARLDQQRLVVAERLQGVDQDVVAAPVARRPPDAAVDHQLLRALGDLGVEIVHEHPQRRLGLPAAGVEPGPARRPDHPLVVASVQLHGPVPRLLATPRAKPLRHYSAASSAPMTIAAPIIPPPPGGRRRGQWWTSARFRQPRAARLLLRLARGHGALRGQPKGPRSTCSASSPTRAHPLPGRLREGGQLMERKVWDAPLLEALSRAMADASICGLGQAAPTDPLGAQVLRRRPSRRPRRPPDPRRPDHTW